MNRLIFFVLISYLLPFSYDVLGQRLGNSFIQNFSPKKYEGEGENWSIVQDQRGIMYFGNNVGVIEFDGINWRIIPVKNNTSVWNLAIDEKGTIYVGASNEFGYLQADEDKGTLHYKSLLDKLPDSVNRKKMGPIMPGIVTKGKDVYFMAETAVYHWNGTRIDVIKPNEEFLGIFIVDEKVWIKEPFEIYELNDGELTAVPYSEDLAQISMENIVDYKGVKLISTLGDGLYLYDTTAAIPVSHFKTEIDVFFYKHYLKDLVILPNKDIMASTTTGGVVRINEEGKLVQSLNKTTGLIEDEVYTLYLDRQNGLWMGTGNGISRVEAGSPITSWYDEVGGWVTGVINYHNTIYATSLGAYYFKGESFHPVKGINPKVQGWTFEEFNLPKSKNNESVLLYGSDEGLFEIKEVNGVPKPKLILEGTVMYILPSKLVPWRVYLGMDTGVRFIEYIENQWYDQGVLNNVTGEARSMVEDKKGNLWIGTNHSGIKYVNFNTFPSDVLDLTVSNYDTLNGLPSMNFNRVYNISGDVIFTHLKGVSYFDVEEQKFNEDTRFEEFYEKNDIYAFQFVEDKSGNIWATGLKTSKHPAGTFVKQDNGSYKWYDTPLRRLPSMEPETVYIDDNSVIWVGGSEGLFRFDAHITPEYEKPYKAIIRKVTLGEDSLFFNGYHVNPRESEIPGLTQNLLSVQVLKYKYNALTFYYSSSSYDEITSNEYSHYLEGFEEGWSEWSYAPKKEYTNLPHGKYDFKIKAKNIYGVESDVISYKFKILPPWYLTTLALIIYIVLFGFSVWIGAIIYNRSLRAEKFRLESVIEEKNTEVGNKDHKIEKQSVIIREAYTNIKTLNEIGKEITTTLNIEKLLQTVYKNVNSLLDASVMGVGIINDNLNTLEFKGSILRGHIIPYHFYDLEDKNKLSIWCIENKKIIKINDFKKQYNDYVEGEIQVDIDRIPKSAVYIPLEIENKVIGVFTVQNFRRNTFNDRDVAILNTLASYIAIAVANTNAFHEIELKNQLINNSFNYAQRVQQAVLPSSNDIEKFLKEYFIIYKPKNVVSGDFYWFNQFQDKIFIAILDCTGHGVPGAFMSLMANELLGDIVNIQKVHSPALILEELHILLKSALGQENGKNTDGLDISLCLLEQGEDYTTKITYAGAKRPLFYIQNSELFELRGERRTIGGVQTSNDQKFKNRELELFSGDTFYMFTDGLVDQNDPERKKLGTPKIRKTLETYMGYSLVEQKEALIEMINQHQQNSSQRDDIAMLGVRV